MEQFDQLLTCAICLDRYRNPKLLPCQHSFCMEPCMEGLVNYVTRQVKCPECRAEHRIPYQGIQQYPTNVTLQRFLELHIEITGELPDPTSGQVMERCGVCSEKAYVSACSHCDKRVCSDCKDAHLDILRREIARVNNQVRRTLPRLTDALSVIEKNTLHLQTNCANVIEEIDDIYHRLSKALKDRTEFLKGEIEVFLAKESRHLSQLKENLDQEISNFDSNSEFAEKNMGEGTVWDDNELLDAKEIFLRTMEFIRSFECETGDYHRRVRFFIPQDPNQLANTLAALGELTITQTQTAGAPQPPQPPTLGPGLMRSKSDHRVAAQFRQAEERYAQQYGTESAGNEDGPRRYFGDRSNTRFGDSSRQGQYGDYETDVTSTDSRRSSRFRSRFMRNLESGDSDNEPTGRSVRFHDQQGNDSTNQSTGAPKAKERSRVIDTEDATRGPLSGITRFMDSPRVMKRLQEMELKDKKKDRPSTLTLPNPQTNTPAVNPASSPLRRAARQVSEDEIDKIKKQNKSAEAAATETPATAAATATSATSASQRKTSSSSQPDTPTSTSSDRSRPTAASRQTSTVEKRDDSADKRTSSYSRSQSQNEEPTRAPPPSTKPAPAPFSRTSSSSSVNQEDERSNGRTRVGDRFKPGRTSTSSDSSTSAESSKHSSPVRNTGAAFSTDELRSRFGTPRKNSNSPNGDTTSPSTTSSSAPRSRFGTVTTPAASSSTPTASRFGSNSSSSSSSSSSASTAAASQSSTAAASAAASAASATTRFQSRFLGRAGTPTAEASKGSENSSSSSEEDSSGSESDSDDDNESAPSAPSTSVSTTPAATPTVRDRELARTDIGPLLARSAQARDSTSSYSTSRSSALETPSSSASSSASSYRRTNPPSVAPPPPSYAPSSSALSRTSTGRFGSVSSSADGASSSSSRFDYSTPTTGLSRSRTGSALHSTDDMENKYPLTSKYLNRSRANLSTDHSTSSASTSDTSSTYTPRYGGYRSRFLNKSKSSAALAPEREEDDDDAGSESPSQDGPTTEGPPQEADQSASNTSPLASGEERYPSGRSRYAALKDRRSRLARSKSSHDVAPAANGVDNSNAETGNNAAEQRSGQVADTGTCSQTNNQEQAGESGSETGTTGGSSLSNWARYLKNKYGPRNKDNATDSSDAESGSQGRVIRKRSIINRPWSPDGPDAKQPTADPILLSPVSPTSVANFSFNHYMQKRKVQLKFGTRGSEPGCFTWPRGVAVGPDNNIVVADSSNHRVQVFDVKGRFVKEFGHYGNGEGEFDCLAGVAVNRIGQYIIADRYNHRIQVFDPSGRFLRVFGSQGSADGKFSYPWGVTTDALGFIYVCDKENHRVQVFQSDGTFVGKFGSLGNRPGQLEHPHYIAVSCTNRVIVSDSNNHRIQVFDVNGKVLTSFGQEGTEEGHFKFPRGVAVDDQGYIIVADSGNNRIQIFSPDGAFIRSFGGWGSGDGEFKGLEGIAVLSNGNIVVCDRENHRIQIF